MMDINGRALFLACVIAWIVVLGYGAISVKAYRSISSPIAIAKGLT